MDAIFKDFFLNQSRLWIIWSSEWVRIIGKLESVGSTLAKPSKDMDCLVWFSKKEMKIETQLIKGKLSVTELKSFFYKLFSDYRMLELYQTGLIEHWRKKYSYGETSPCESQKKINKLKQLRRLNLKDLASAFFILALGISASLLIFLVEQCRRFKKIVVKPLIVPKTWNLTILKKKQPTSNITRKYC